MPAIVDHDQRRQEIAEIAATLVATGGADAVTVRAVAKLAGFSTKAISHYFENKRDLLLATYRFAASRSATITEATQTVPDIDVIRFVQALLPIEPTQRQNWLIWYAFWGHAITDSEFAMEQRSQVDRTRRRIRELMQRDVRFQTSTPAMIRRSARDALSEVIGISLQAIFDQSYWTPARQRSAVKRRVLACAGA